MTSSRAARLLALGVSAIIVLVFLIMMNGRSMRHWMPFDLKLKVHDPDPKLSEPRKMKFNMSSSVGAHRSSDSVNSYSEEEVRNKHLAKKQPGKDFQIYQRQAEMNPTKTILDTNQQSQSQKKSFYDKSNESSSVISAIQTSPKNERPTPESLKRVYVDFLRGKNRGIPSIPEWKTDIPSLVEMLTNKIESARVKEIKLEPTCASNDTIANSCSADKKRCLRMQLPRDMRGRVVQLVNPVKLQLSHDIHQALREMAEKVVGHHDVILITAASSNHYYESQAMMKNVHENVFPIMKNFTFVFYNLGLSAKERQSMVEHCKCQVLDFPFEKFPAFMRKLSCFSWKPVLIKAHILQANVLIWADASIRFHTHPHHLYTLIEHTRRRGLQIGGSSNVSPFRTFRGMYHYFGDEPCAYLGLGQAKATIGFYGRDPFVDRAILEPWVACAVHEECMCMSDPGVPLGKGCSESKRMARWYEFNNGPIQYGLCHRFDQSAISLILHKLYQGYNRWVMVNVLEYVDFRRGHTLVYFPN